MPHHLRYQSHPWATHHVVSRCIQGFSFLKPTPEINATIRGVFCYSLDKYRHVIEAHSFGFMSNHFHLVISAAETKHMAQFMAHFKGNLARELGRIHGWCGPLWQGRYSSEELLDRESVEERIKYVNKNSVKESLVDHLREWVGLHSYHQLVLGEPLRGRWLNRTRLYHAQKRANTRGECINKRDFMVEYEVQLTPPPLMRSALREERAEMLGVEVSQVSKEELYEAYRARYEELADEAIKEALKDREVPAMGMERVLAEDVFIPRLLKKRSPRRLCRAQCVERLKAFKLAYLEFKAKFQEASAALREAIALRDTIELGAERIRIRFPEGGVPLFGGRAFEMITLESAT